MDKTNRRARLESSFPHFNIPSPSSDYSLFRSTGISMIAEIQNFWGTKIMRSRRTSRARAWVDEKNVMTSSMNRFCFRTKIVSTRFFFFFSFCSIALIRFSWLDTPTFWNSFSPPSLERGSVYRWTVLISARFSAPRNDVEKFADAPLYISATLRFIATAFAFRAALCNHPRSA